MRRGEIRNGARSSPLLKSDVYFTNKAALAAQPGFTCYIGTKTVPHLCATGLILSTEKLTDFVLAL